MVDYFSLISALVSIIFLSILIKQYINQRKKHQLIWVSALAMWFFTTLLLFLAEPEILGWNPLMYKAFYVFSAPLVALLGVGSLFLLTHKNWGKYFLIYSIIISAAMIILGLTSNIQEELLTSGPEIAGLAMPQYVRLISPFLTVPGGLLLIGGAIYSYWLDRTRHYNLLIFVGGLSPFLGGIRARLADTTFFSFVDPQSFSILQLFGVILLFLGFVLSIEYQKSHKK